MHNSSSRIILLILALLIIFFCTGSKAQNCGIVGQVPPNFVTIEAQESHPVDGILISNLTENVSEIEVADPNPYITFEFTSETSTLAVRLTKSLSDRLDEGENTIVVISNLNCNDGTQRSITFTIEIKDENNREPKFDLTEYSITLQTPWPINLPINVLVPIRVQDADFDLSNAQLTFETSNPSLFKVTETLESTSSPYSYSLEIDLLSTDISEPTFEIIANDGVNEGRTTVQLTLTPMDIKAPEFSSSHYRSGSISNPSVGDPIVLDSEIQASDAENNNFVFSLSGPNADLVEVDPANTDPTILKLRFKDVSNVELLENGIAIVTVTATETEENLLHSSSTVILFFDTTISSTSSSSSPSTTDASTSSDCPDISTFVTEPCTPCSTTIEPIECSTSISTLESCAPCPSSTPEYCTPCPSPSTETYSSSTASSISSSFGSSIGSSAPIITTEGNGGSTECPTTSESCECESISTPAECPTTGEPCECESSSTPAECPTTGEPCECESNSTPAECEDCDCECDEENCEDSSNAGFIAGLVVTSVLFVGSAILAGYLWLKLRKVRAPNSLIKNLDPVEKWDPPRQFSTTSENFRAPTTITSTNGDNILNGRRKSSLKVNFTPDIETIPENTVASTEPEVQATNHLVETTTVPQTVSSVPPPEIPEPDYRTKPDYSVRIQDSAEVIPDHVVEYSDSEESSKHSISSGDGDIERL